MVDGALYVGRHNFGLVNPEIRKIEGRIIEDLLYILNMPKTKFQFSLIVQFIHLGVTMH